MLNERPQIPPRLLRPYRPYRSKDYTASMYEEKRKAYWNSVTEYYKLLADNPNARYIPSEPDPVAPQYVSNYDDPYEVNSIADVVLATFDKNMNRTELGGIEDIPILNMLPSLILDILWDKNLRPIVEGRDFKAAGINLLTNAFETLDFAVNPVRALVQGENILDSMGWGGHGRSNFDYDIHTGAGGAVDFVANFAAEFVSDPLNWISFGAKGLLKGGVKELFSESFEKAMKIVVAESMDDIVEEVGEKLARVVIDEDIAGDIFKRAYRAWKEGANTTRVFDITFQTSKGAKGFSDIFKETIAQYEQQIGKTILKNVTPEAFTVGTKRALTYAAEMMDNKLAGSVLTGLRGLVFATENVQKGLLATVLRTSPVGIGFIGAKALARNSLAATRLFNRVKTRVGKTGAAAIVDLEKIQQDLTDLVKANEQALSELGYTAEEASEAIMDDIVQQVIIKDTDKLIEFTKSFKGDMGTFSAEFDKLIAETYAEAGIKNFDELYRALSDSDNALLQETADRLIYNYRRRVYKEANRISLVMRKIAEQAAGFDIQQELAYISRQSADEYVSRKLLAISEFSGDDLVDELKLLLEDATDPQDIRRISIFLKRLTADGTVGELLAQQITALRNLDSRFSEMLLGKTISTPEEIYNLIDDIHDVTKKNTISKLIKDTQTVDNLRCVINVPDQAVLESAVGRELFEDYKGTAADSLSLNNDAIALRDTIVDQLSEEYIDVEGLDFRQAYIEESINNLAQAENFDELYAAIKELQRSEEIAEIINNDVTETFSRYARSQQVRFDQAKRLSLASTTLYKLQVRSRVLYRQAYDAVGNIVDNLADTTKLRSDILRMPDTANTKQELFRMTNAVRSYNELEQTVFASDLTGELKESVMDVMHTFKKTRLNKLTNTLERNQFFHGFERILREQLYAQHYEFNLNIKNVVTRHAAEWGLPDGWEAMLHSASGDVDMTKMIVERVLQADFNGKIPIYFDFETTSLKLNIADPVQFAFRIGDDTARVFSMNHSKMPELGAIATMLGDEAKGLTADELQALWIKKLVTVQENTINDALIALSDTIRAANGNVVLVGHNSNAFDMPLLQRLSYTAANDTPAAREAKLYLQAYLKQFPESYDALSELIAKEGWNALDDVSLEKIKRFVNQYINARLADAKTLGLDQTLLYEMNQNVVSMIRQTREAMFDSVKDDALLYNELADSLNLLSNTDVALSEALKQISIINRYLEGYGWIEKEVFGFEELKNLGILDVSRLTHTLATDLNSRKTFNIFLVRQYFDVETLLKSANLEGGIGEHLFRKAEVFDRLVNGIHNPALLTDPVEMQLDNLIKLWTPVLEQFDGNWGYVRPFDRYQKYAVAQQMFNDLKRAGQKAWLNMGELTGNPDAMRLLRQPDLIRASSTSRVLRPALRVFEARSAVTEFSDMLNSAKNVQDGIARFNDSKGFFKTGDKTGFVLQRAIIGPLYETIEFFNQMPNTGAIKNALINYTDARHVALLDDLIQQPADEFAKNIWSAHSGFLYLDFDVARLPQEVQARYTAWVAGLDDLQQYGLATARIGDAVYIGIDAARITDFNKLPLNKVFEKDFNIVGFNDATTAQLKKLYDMLDTYTEGRIRYSTGAVMTQKKAQNVFNLLSESAQKNFVSPEILASYDMYQYTSYDRSILGHSDLRAANVPNTRPNVLRDWVSSAEDLLTHADGALKIRIMYYGENSPYLVKNMFAKVSPDELMKSIENSDGDYALTIMEESAHSKTGFVIREIAITPKNLALDGVVLLPRAMAFDTMRVLNHIDFKSNFMRAVNKLVISPMKAGYLMTMGWVMRNFVSSELVNAASLRSLDELPELLKCQWRATQILRKYTEWYQRAVELSEELAENARSGLTNAAGIEALKKELTAEEWLLYQHADRFMSSSASGGQLDAVIKAVEGSAKNKDWIDKGGDAIQKFLWEKNPIGLMLKKPNEFLEQANRFGKYIYELEYGAPSDIALSRVIRTHFNYDKNTYAQLLLDTVLPFSGFMFNNFKFWAEHITKYGWIGKLMTDAIQEIVELEDYDNYELNENRSLQYNILQGNPIYEDNMTLKLSLGVMDAYNILIDPYGSLSGRINALIRIPVEAIMASVRGEAWTPTQVQYEVSTNLPIIGPLLQKWYPETKDPMTGLTYIGSALEAFKRTDAEATLAAPSLFGGVKRAYFFTYDNGDQIYRTDDYEKYLAHLENGATPIRTAQQLEELRALATGKKPRRRYRPRKLKMRKVYPRKTYARKTYARQINPKGVYNKIMYAIEKSRPRPVERSAKIIGPRLYKKLYTAKGQSRFQSRLLPVTPKNLKYKIRQGWSFLR